MQKVQIQTIPTKPLRRKRAAVRALHWSLRIAAAGILAKWILTMWGII